MQMVEEAVVWHFDKYVHLLALQELDLGMFKQVMQSGSIKAGLEAAGEQLPQFCNINLNQWAFGQSHATSSLHAKLNETASDWRLSILSPNSWYQHK